MNLENSTGDVYENLGKALNEMTVNPKGITKIV